MSHFNFQNGKSKVYFSCVLFFFLTLVAVPHFRTHQISADTRRPHIKVRPNVISDVSLASPADPNQVGDTTVNGGFLLELTGRERNLSANGQFVVYRSLAPNLVAGQVDNTINSDIFVFDRVAGTNRLVSGVNGSATVVGNDFSTRPAISGNGQFIAFLSKATNLVPGQVDTNNELDAFVFDRVNGTTRLASGVNGSTTQTGNDGVNGQFRLDISGDGQFIVFSSDAENLVPGQTDNNAVDVFAFDRVNGTTRLVSGVNGSATQAGNGGSLNGVINQTNGRFIAFTSFATDLVPGQVDAGANSADVFVFDQVNGTTRLVSGVAGSTTDVANESSFIEAISGNGDTVVFSSNATNVVTGQVDANNTADLFVFDRVNGTSELVSGAAASATVTGNEFSASNISTTENGNLIAFLSQATNLVPGQVDINQDADVFVFDRIANTTRLISHQTGSATTAADDPSNTALISADGSAVAFSSEATNLIAGQNDQLESEDIFVFSLTNNTTQLFSGDNGSTLTGNRTGFSTKPVLSQDGSIIAFESAASNLVPNDFNQGLDVMVVQTSNRQTQLATLRAGVPSVTPFGTSDIENVSANGRFIVFRSDATNLVPGQNDTNVQEDLFVFDTQAGTTRLVTGVEGSATTTVADFEVDHEFGSISADGRFITFRSNAVNLIAGQVDEPFTNDIFVFDQVSGTTSLVSRVAGTTNTATGGALSNPAISADGNFIAFESGATNLVAGVNDANQTTDIFLFNRQAGTVQLVTAQAGSSTTTANGNSRGSSISADGRCIAYESQATNLVAGIDDLNSNVDVFVFDRLTGTTQLVSQVFGGFITANQRSAAPTVSADGNFIVFESQATNLVENQVDSNNFNQDVFVFDRIARVNHLVSRAAGTVNTTGSDGSQLSEGGKLNISANGRFVAYASKATNLVTGFVDGNGAGFTDVFVFDLTTGLNQLVSGAGTSAVNGADELSTEPALSFDGRIIVFESRATNQVENQVKANADSDADVFVFDQIAGTEELVSRQLGTQTTTGNEDSAQAVVSGTGSLIAFESNASNLIEADFNDQTDVFYVEQASCDASIGAPSPLTACQGTATGSLLGNVPPDGSTGLWDDGGAGGTFIPDANTPDASYAPPSTFTGTITLTWTISGGGCGTSAASIDVNVLPNLVVNAGPDQVVCIGQTVQLAGSFVGDAAFAPVWTTGGTGTFSPDANTLNAIYIPSALDLEDGLVLLTLTSPNAPADVCGNSVDEVQINFEACVELPVLFVADTNNHRVQRFDGATWSVILGNGVRGSSLTQASAPEAVTANFDGSTIYVADTGNNRILRSTNSGASWSVLAASGVGLNQVKAPKGLALDLQGNLYVADTGNQRVLRFNNGVPGAAVVLATIGSGGGQVRNPNGLAVDPENNLYIADRDNNRILILSQANAVAAANTSTIFVSGPGAGLTQVRNPEGVAVDNTGNLFVADTGNHRVLQFSTLAPRPGTVRLAAAPGTAITSTGSSLGQTNAPEGVTVSQFTAGTFAGQSLLVIGDTGNNRIQGRPVAGGTFQLVGVPNNIGSSAGQFRNPSKIR